MSEYRDNDAEKITGRSWHDIRDEWRNYVPDHEHPWPVPELEVCELDSVGLRLSNLGGPKKRDSTIDDEIDGLRKAALHEAVILIHKAGNVLHAAGDEGERGYRTWCRSSAYHAAFFAMRGVLGLLGVMVFRSGATRSDYQVDLWAPRLSRKAGLTESRFAVRIIKRERRVEHKEMWGIFSRVLRVTKVDQRIWPGLAADPLRRLNPGDFSLVRRKLHYHSTGWLYQDIDSLIDCDSFSCIGGQPKELKYLDNPEDYNFPLALALHTLILGIALLSDLGEDIPSLGVEAKRARKWMSSSPWGQAVALAEK